MSNELVIDVATIGELQFALGRAANAAGKGLEKGPIQIALRHKQARRSTDQNRLLWAILRDVSQQVEWYGQYLADEEWKDVMTCALKRQKVVPGIEGGFIMIGGRTSKMTKQEFSDLVDLIHAFGNDHGVRWSDPALKAYEEMGVAA